MRRGLVPGEHAAERRVGGPRSRQERAATLTVALLANPEVVPAAVVVDDVRQRLAVDPGLLRDLLHRLDECADEEVN